MTEVERKASFSVAFLDETATSLVQSFWERYGFDPEMTAADRDLAEQKRLMTGQDHGYYRRETVLAQGIQYGLIVQVGIRGVVSNGEEPHPHLIFTHTQEDHLNRTDCFGNAIILRRRRQTVELAYPLQASESGVFSTMTECDDGSGGCAYFRIIDHDPGEGVMTTVTTQKVDQFDLGPIFELVCGFSPKK